MKKLFPGLLIFALLMSCNKEKTGSNTKEVHVRLQNASGITLENAHVANNNYGSVQPGSSTAYQVMTLPVYAGFCTFSSGGIEKSAGYGICGTPMPPSFEAGYYTFEVEPAVSGFNMITVTKE